jgi:multidrug efflux pump subunit AcrB
MNVSTWSIKNPIPALMLFVLLTFGGLIVLQWNEGAELS